MEGLCKTPFLLLASSGGTGYGTPLVYKSESDQIAANGQTEQEADKNGDQMLHLGSAITGIAAVGFFLCALCCIGVAFSRNKQIERSPADILLPSSGTAPTAGTTELTSTASESTTQIVVDKDQATSHLAYRR